MFFKENHTTLFDSHTHLNTPEFDKDIDEVIQRSLDADVEHIVDVAVNFDSSKKSIALSKKYLGIVFSTVGIDPDTVIPSSPMFKQVVEFDSYLHNCFSELYKLIEENQEFVVGIGETGVDTHWIAQSVLSVSDQESVVNKQLALLNVHTELASHFKLPLTIHSRGYEEELVESLKGRNLTGVFHSYTGSLETAKKILDAGFGLGINGIITFKNAQDMRDMYKELLGGVKINSPEDLYSRNIFLETDAPYLSPSRGERNEPKNIADIFKFIQENIK
jgi:TatD DNase family protein